MVEEKSRAKERKIKSKMKEKSGKNMNGAELLIMIAKKRVDQSGDCRKSRQRGKSRRRRCQDRIKTKHLLDYQTT